MLLVEQRGDFVLHFLRVLLLVVKHLVAGVHHVAMGRHAVVLTYWGFSPLWVLLLLLVVPLVTRL